MLDGALLDCEIQGSHDKVERKLCTQKYRDAHGWGHINLNKSVKIAPQAEVAHLLESHANQSVMVYT